MNNFLEGSRLMTANRIPTRLRTLGVPLGLAGALGLALVASTGFSGAVVAKPSTDRTAAEAQTALKKGKVEKAIALTEALVAANPREPSYRTLLGQAYMKAGRFDSAATTFDDAMKLGDNTARTALALSLARVAQGRNREAVAILDDWRDAIPASDLGLALALSGETSRGVAILADAVRSGDQSAKTRQNLAYAYALDGRWREARVMAEQDVPADQVDKRISEWAARAKPEDNALRVAGLLGAPLRADPGQPTALALNASPAQEQLAVETAATQTAPALAAKGELPATSEAPEALAVYRPVDAPVEAAPAPRTFDSAFAAQEVGQPVAAAAPQPKVKPAAKKARVLARHKPGLRPRQASVKFGNGSTHLVQLGSFFTAQGARRAWGIYAAQNPELKNYKMTITQAKVRGRNYFRVAAGGLNGKGASGLCGTVKNRGGACFAYALPPRSGNAPVYARAAKPAVKVAPRAATPAIAVRTAAGPASARTR
jgi:Flp pilus assembly protein TadD